MSDLTYHPGLPRELFRTRSEDLGDRDLEARKKGGAKDGAEAEDGFSPEAVAGIGEDLDSLCLRICDPELAYAEAGVELGLHSAVAVFGRRRKDLDHEIRRGRDELLADDGRATGSDEEQIWLHDIRGREDYVAGGHQDLSQFSGPDMVIQKTIEPPDETLVGSARRGRLEEISIDDLVAAVLGKEEVILIGEPQRGGRGHGREF